MAEKEEHKINLIVVTPYQYFYEGLVTVATIPSIDGEIGVMAGHSPLVFALKPGTVTVRVDNEVKHFVVSEGYAEVNREMVLVVCNSAEWAENINIRWIFEAYEEAKKAIARLPEDVILPRVRALAPSLSVTLSCRPAFSDDQALYVGKRTIMAC